MSECKVFIPVLFENIEVHGFEETINSVTRAMGRKNETDSGWVDDDFDDPIHEFYDWDLDTMCKKVIGPKDLKYLQALIAMYDKTYSCFRKGIVVWATITADPQWWKWFNENEIGDIINPGCTDIAMTRDIITDYERLSFVYGRKDFEPLFNQIPYSADLLTRNSFLHMLKCYGKQNATDDEDNFFYGGD